MAKNEVKYRPATMAEIEGRDVNLYMNGEQVWVMLVQRSETVGEGEAKVDYIMLTNTKKVQVGDLQVIDDAPEESPMMKQFRELKTAHKNAILLFRCGDFYETYEDDAAEAAKILGITLTKSTTTGVRMAGFPHHALDTYLPKLIRAGKRVAICDPLPEPPKTKRGITETINDNNNNQTSEETTMAKKNSNNESANVQNAQVNNNAAAIVDVNVGEVTVDNIMPVMQPAESEELRVKSEESAPTKQEVAEAISKAANDGKATTMPLGDHGTLVIGGCGFTPKTTKSGKPKSSEKGKVKSEKSAAAQMSSLPRVTLVIYTTKRGEQAPRIEGFGGENDPRWKRHYDEKVRLAKEKKEADKFNEKLAEKMKGKSKDEREKLRKQWKSVGSDPFGASYFTDRTTGDKYYQMTMGAKYMEVARELVAAYNGGDEQAIAAAEQAVIDCKNGIVKDIEAQRDAKRAEREAQKSEKGTVKSEESATAQATAPAMSGEEQAMFDLFKKFMAGDKDAMAKVGAVLNKAA